MTDGCFRLEELDSILDISPEDPRQQHLAECPLCRARLAAYRTFLAEGPPLAGSRPKRAKAELEAFIAGMVQGIETEAEKGFWTRFRARRIPKRVIIPGLVAAAAAAVVLIIVLNPFTGGDRRRPAPLRSLESPTVGGAVLSAQPAVIRDGTITFRWSPLPDSDRYEVQIFDTKLEMIARFEANRDTSLRIQTVEIPAVGGPFLWRVIAFREGDEFARSRLGSLDLGEH